MNTHPTARVAPLGLGALGVALLMSASACARQETMPRPSTSEITAAPLPATEPARAPAPPAIVVTPEVQSKCNLHAVESTAESPKFAFDSSLISTDELGTLQQLATCFTTGPLAGRAMTLIGRADPRGLRTYNQTLGEKRANAVQGALVNFGMALSRVASTSRGAKDATGKDEDGWQIDRRVDVGVDAVK